MKKLFIYLLSAIMMFAAGCSESYDDSALVGRVDSLENRVAKLEELCRQMNTNISSLQTLVNALENNDYVTGVTPITKDGEVVGYTITFTKSQPITIYHGENGQNGTDGVNGTNGKDGDDGATPVIGVKQDTDGIYYWTLNGDWLLDKNGNKIKAQGTDGKDGENGADGTNGTNGENGKDGENGADGEDGITPQLKIENEYWYISYDNGSTWTQLGKATGNDGKNGEDGDSFFQSIDTSNSDYVIFTLADGTEIYIPRYSQNTFSIIFEETDFVIGDIDELNIPFTITGTTGTSEIDAIVLSSNNNQSAKIVMQNETSGILHIENLSSENDFKVLIIASNNGRTTHKLVTIKSGEIYLYDYFEVSGYGETLEIPVTTNYDYNVVIPNEYASWIKYVQTKLRNETIVLSIDQNKEGHDRYGEIELRDIKFGSLIARICIYQPPLELSLSTNKTYFEADGIDFVQFTVESGQNTITEDVEFYTTDNEKLEIEDLRFKTTSVGSHSIYAKYQGITSNTIHLLAKDENTPEYIAITGETGADDIKCAVLGLDGSILYYHTNSSNPESISKISKYNNITKEIEFVINFNDDGLVKNIMTPELIAVLDNYHDNYVDATIYTSNNEPIVLENIEYDNFSFLTTRAPSGIEIANLVVSGVATGLEIAAIASVGVAAAGPVAVAAAAIGVALLAYDAATAFDLIDESVTGDLTGNLIGHYGNLASLAASFPKNRLEIIAALFGAASDITGLIEMFESESNAKISKGEGTGGNQDESTGGNQDGGSEEAPEW